METLTCILCPNGCRLEVEETADGILVKGNLCKRGIEFAKNEIENPMRIVTTTIKTKYSEIPRLPVKTDGDIPKKDIQNLMEYLKYITIDRVLDCGDIVAYNVLNSGVNIVSTSDMHLYVKEVQ